VRFFFAAFPTSESRQRMQAAALAFGLPADARLVPAENYHLTLAFAGEVSNAQAAALRSVGAAMRSAVFAIRFDLYEHWPKAAVVVAAAGERPAALVELHERLCVELDRLGIATDPYAFRPHVTIARKVAQAPVFKAMPEFSWRVNAFQLVHSARSNEGSVYTVVDQWQLLDKPASAN
jgi:RNA 2',3'-cyclic 3'-phosphodiesterase